MKILVTHQKGGVGKSTVSIALANFFLSEGIKPALVDMDLQGSIISFSNIYKKKGIDVYSRLTWKEIQELPNEVTIIDTPPYLYDGVKDFKENVNFVIVPIILNLYDIGAVNGTIKLLEDNNLIDKSFLLINHNNKSREKKNLEVVQQLNKLNIHLLENRFDYSVQFQRVAEGEYEVKVREQVENVIAEIINTQTKKQNG